MKLLGKVEEPKPSTDPRTDRFEFRERAAPHYEVVGFIWHTSDFSFDYKIDVYEPFDPKKHYPGEDDELHKVQLPQLFNMPKSVVRTVTKCKNLFDRFLLGEITLYREEREDQVSRKLQFEIERLNLEEQESILKMIEKKIQKRKDVVSKLKSSPKIEKEEDKNDKAREAFEAEKLGIPLEKWEDMTKAERAHRIKLNKPNPESLENLTGKKDKNE
jgi:hypothetical protein